MVFHQALQTSRYELKYIIEEARAQAVRQYIHDYLMPRGWLTGDPYGDPVNHSYPVYSLYLDSPTLCLYRQTLQGLKNRFKLRMRFYNGDPSAPVFLEVKRRLTDVIAKRRASVTRKAAAGLLEGVRPDFCDLVSQNGSAKAVAALHEFCQTMAAIQATPCMYVCYQRDAYISPNSNQVRVTFDHTLRGRCYDPVVCGRGPDQVFSPPSGGLSPHIVDMTSGFDEADPEHPGITGGEGSDDEDVEREVRRPCDAVILELKFTDRFPQWMHELVQQFNLRRRSAAKYVFCVDAVRTSPAHRLGLQLRLVP
jgi:hypothetical protein